MDSENYQAYDEILQQLMSTSKLFIHFVTSNLSTDQLRVVLLHLEHEGLITLDRDGLNSFYRITSPGANVYATGGYKRYIEARMEKEQIDLETKKLTLADLQHTVKTNSPTFYLLVIGAALGLLSFVMQLMNQK